MSTEQREIENQSKVIPVFTTHLTDFRKLIAFRKEIEQGSSLPDFWMYPTNTTTRLKQLQPGLIAIDGLFPEVNTQRMLFFSPGNPLELQPAVFVAADLPVSEFMGRNPNARFTERVLREYWSKTIRGNAEDPNQDRVLTRWRSSATQVLPEFAVLYVIDRVVDHLAGASSIPGMSTSALLYTDMARFFANRSMLRRISQFMNPELFMTLSRLTKPVFFPTEDVDIRNAITSVKLSDSFDRKDGQLDRTTAAAVFGINHANGQVLWNDPKKQQEVIEDAIVKVHRIAEKLAQKEGVRLDEAQRRDLHRGAVRFFAQTTLWSLKSIPKRANIKSIRSQLQRDNFNNPTITTIIDAVFANC